MDEPVLDTLRRPLRDLRISVTDRCNFRCVYCMPKEVFGRDYPFLPRAELLTFEEIERLARVFAAHGRPEGPAHGRRAAAAPGPRDSGRHARPHPGARPDADDERRAPAKKAQALADAGLRRITVSLDSLDDATFRRMNDVDFPVDRVLAGIEAAQAAGLDPVKVNVVVKRGVNEHDVLPLARAFRGTRVILRFIEFMDVGATNGWRLDDVVPGGGDRRRDRRRAPARADRAEYRGEVARRYRYRDGAGEIGVIASVTQPFCGDCTRARISADGTLYTCLFAARGTTARAAAGRRHRRGARRGRRRDVGGAKRPLLGAPDRRDGRPARVEMSYIGG